MNDVHQGNIDSWAYPWALCCWMHHGLTAIPAVNLVSNTGFGEDATHTRRKNPIAGLPTESLGTIRHPELVARHFAADQFTDDLVFSGSGRRRSPLRRIGQALRFAQSSGLGCAGAKLALIWSVTTDIAAQGLRLRVVL